MKNNQSTAHLFLWISKFESLYIIYFLPSLLRLCCRGSHGNNPLWFHLCLNLKSLFSKYRWSKDAWWRTMLHTYMWSTKAWCAQRSFKVAAKDYCHIQPPTMCEIWSHAPLLSLAMVLNNSSVSAEHYDITQKLTFKHNIVLSFHHFHPIIHCACGPRVHVNTCAWYMALFPRWTWDLSCFFLNTKRCFPTWCPG